MGVAAVEARNAGVDCTESMRARKRAVYSMHLDALEAEGVEYRPLVWSFRGREHPDTTAVLACLARRAARRVRPPLRQAAPEIDARPEGGRMTCASQHF